MLKKIIENIEMLKSTSSILSKKEILKNTESELMKKILFNTYDPFVNFYIRGDNKKILDYSNTNYSTSTEMFFEVLNKLESREVTGNSAIDTINELFKTLHQDEQTLFRQILNKDLRCNMGVKIINAIFPKLIREYNPMLADSINNGRILDLKAINDLPYPIIADMKEDGIRMTYINMLRTRNGKEINGYDEIKAELNHMLSLYPNYIFDGELETDSLNNAMKQLNRKYNKTTGHFKYVLFDCLSSINDQTNYNERRQRLEKIYNECKSKFNLQYIELSEIKQIDSSSDLLNYFQYINSIKKEGLVLKLDKPYEWKRSKHWLKMKEFNSLDLKIVDIQEGTGKYVNKMGALIVDYEGVNVHIGSGYTDEEREDFWINKNNFIGKLAEVSYKEISANKSLQFPTFLRIREDLT